MPSSPPCPSPDHRLFPTTNLSSVWLLYSIRAVSLLCAKIFVKCLRIYTWEMWLIIIRFVYGFCKETNRVAVDAQPRPHKSLRRIFRETVFHEKRHGGFRSILILTPNPSTKCNNFHQVTPSAYNSQEEWKEHSLVIIFCSRAKLSINMMASVT
jgi:hypothetical protein